MSGEPTHPVQERLLEMLDDKTRLYGALAEENAQLRALLGVAAEALQKRRDGNDRQAKSRTLGQRGSRQIQRDDA